MTHETIEAAFNNVGLALLLAIGAPLVLYPLFIWRAYREDKARLRFNRYRRR
jgi:hypothetical protein